MIDQALVQNLYEITYPNSMTEIFPITQEPDSPIMTHAVVGPTSDRELWEVYTSGWDAPCCEEYVEHMQEMWQDDQEFDDTKGAPPPRLEIVRIRRLTAAETELIELKETVRKMYTIFNFGPGMTGDGSIPEGYCLVMELTDATGEEFRLPVSLEQTAIISDLLKKVPFK